MLVFKGSLALSLLRTFVIGLKGKVEMPYAAKGKRSSSLVFTSMGNAIR